MSQIERQSEQLVGLIEGLEDAFVLALADDLIDAVEAIGLKSEIDLLHEVAMDHDETQAIGIAIIRTGVVSQRSQRLLRQRENRLERNAGSASAAA